MLMPSAAERRRLTALFTALFAFIASAHSVAGDVASLPAAPSGYPFANATASCSPWDGPATTLYLTSVPIAPSVALPPEGPHVSVSLYRDASALAGTTFTLPGKKELGVAVNCRAPQDCEQASAATVRFRSSGDARYLEGTVDISFPGRGRVTGGFRATLRPQPAVCG
jgi:hypothetical protein